MYRIILSLILIYIPLSPAIGMFDRGAGSASDHERDESEGLKVPPLRIQFDRGAGSASDHERDESEGLRVPPLRMRDAEELSVEVKSTQPLSSKPDSHRRRKRCKSDASHEKSEPSQGFPSLEPISGTQSRRTERASFCLPPLRVGPHISSVLGPLTPTSRIQSTRAERTSLRLPSLRVSSHISSVLGSIQQDDEEASPIEQFPSCSPNINAVPRPIVPTRDAPVTIVSIDGGGIRGAIPAWLLGVLEDATELPTSRLFRLAAGTSTGGILTLGLTVPDPNRQGYPRFSAHNLFRLYQEEGGTIFSRRLVNPFGLRKSKYRAGPLERLLGFYLGEEMLENALIPVLIPSFDIERKKPKLFKSHSAQRDASRNFLMKDVARATSAAPTYFRPAEIFSAANDSGYRQKVVAVDGGVCANNPALCALCEARRLYPNASEYILVSLGTGRATVPLFYTDAKDMGVLGWGTRIPNVFTDSSVDITDYILSSMSNIPQERLRYFRFQPELQDINAAMDDTSPQNIAALSHRAEAMAGTREFQDLIRLLRSLPRAEEHHESLQIADRRFSII